MIFIICGWFCVCVGACDYLFAMRLVLSKRALLLHKTNCFGPWVVCYLIQRKIRMSLNVLNVQWMLLLLKFPQH